MSKVKNRNKFIICLLIVIISIVLLVTYMFKNNFELRPLIFEWIKIFVLIFFDIYLLILCFKKEKYVKYFFIFLFLFIIIFNKIKYINIKESIVIKNNVKLVKVKNDWQCSFDYYKYVNLFFMSKNKLISEEYARWSFKSRYFYEHSSKHDFYIHYYSNELEKYSDSEIEIISRKSCELNKKIENRIVKTITNEDELKKFNETIYDILDNETIDFSNYNLIAISYNTGEIVPFYLGKLDNDLNLVIKSKQEKYFSKLLVLKIEKNEFENIRVSDLDTYENPF